MKIFQNIAKWYVTARFRTELLHYFYRLSPQSKYNPKNDSRKWLLSVELFLVLGLLPLMPVFWWLRQFTIRWVVLILFPRAKNHLPIAWLSRYAWYRKRIGGHWYENRHWNEQHKIAVYIWSRRHSSAYPYSLGITTALMEQYPVLVQTKIDLN